MRLRVSMLAGADLRIGEGHVAEVQAVRLTGMNELNELVLHLASGAQVSVALDPGDTDALRRLFNALVEPPERRPTKFLDVSDRRAIRSPT